MIRFFVSLAVVSFVAACSFSGDSDDNFRIRSVIPVESELIFER